MDDKKYSYNTQTYTSFSGSEISCKPYMGKIDGITWTVIREKAPIYEMGSNGPRSFSHRKRGIAGSILFTSVVDSPPTNGSLGLKMGCSDHIAPFDVEIKLLNEFGVGATKSIYGIELLGEGSGATKLIVDEPMNFVARNIGPMYAGLGPKNKCYKDDKDGL